MFFKHAFTAVLAATASLVTAAPTIHEPRGVDFNWGQTKVRGVNIGGWLVLESFITPSIFYKHSSNDDVYDEWTLCKKLGKDGCYDALKPHWDNFVTVSDFWKIKNAGLNVVRVPVGYWSYLDVGGPYIMGAAEYLDKAIEWARETGLKLIIDLHGAPGSQNGFDHSGQRMEQPQWGQGDTINQTHTVLKMLYDKYAIPDMQDVVIAIQPLNEPLLTKLDSNMVKQFYRDAFFSLRTVSDTPAIFHNGFWESRWLNSFLTPSDNDAQNVIVDHHEYQIFDPNGVSLSPEQHVGLICGKRDLYSGSDKWGLVGEWSAAMTDCAPHLNGFNRGSRYEGKFWGSWYVSSCQGKSGRVNDWDWDWKMETRRYLEAQLDAFEDRTQGWVFWNFKTENEGAGEWDLFQLLDESVFPQPLENRWFERACG